MIFKLENHVDQKFDEAVIKYSKENILSDFKQQISDAAKAEDCNEWLADSLKDQINSLQNEILFLWEELKVKNHLLQLTITSKKIGSGITYRFRQQIGHHPQKISNEKRCCSTNVNDKKISW